jgi:hypothetical protein
MSKLMLLFLLGAHNKLLFINLVLVWTDDYQMTPHRQILTAFGKAKYLSFSQF